MDRRLSVDLLKIALAMMVVGIHANPFRPLGQDAVLLTGQGLYRLAVPTFFVINGYFFHDTAMAGRVWPYVRRLLWLFVAWTALYLPGWYGLFLSDNLAMAVQSLLVGWWQLWYLPALAIAAALAAAIRHWSVPVLTAVMAATFLAGCALVYGLALGVVAKPDWFHADPAAMHRNGFLLGLPYLLAGMLIRRTGLADRLALPVIGVALAAGIALLLIEAVALNRLFPRGVSHDNLFALGLACPALFLMALKFPRQAVRRDLGTYANGIYFLHVAFCILCFRTTDLPRPPIYLIAVTGSVVVTWLMLRTGLARRLL